MDVTQLYIPLKASEVSEITNLESFIYFEKLDVTYISDPAVS